jgi:hypothetical protein
MVDYCHSKSQKFKEKKITVLANYHSQNGVARNFGSTSDNNNNHVSLSWPFFNVCPLQQQQKIRGKLNVT